MNMGKQLIRKTNAFNKKGRTLSIENTTFRDLNVFTIRISYTVRI
jgi:hypothetical protein